MATVLAWCTLKRALAWDYWVLWPLSPNVLLDVAGMNERNKVALIAALAGLTASLSIKFFLLQKHYFLGAIFLFCVGIAAWVWTKNRKK